jgi:hypothetical protein
MKRLLLDGERFYDAQPEKLLCEYTRIGNEKQEGRID